MSFVRDQWYVAAYSAEVGRTLLARTILNEPLVLYRTSAGQPAALADRCVHRHFPLSAGQLQRRHDRVRGPRASTYAADRPARRGPWSAAHPADRTVGADPVAEQARPRGSSSAAQSGPLPGSSPAPAAGPLGYTTVRGMEPLAAGFKLLVDNLLELQLHETYLHGGYISTLRTRTPRSAPRSTRSSGSSGSAAGWTTPPARPFYAKSTGISGRIVRWQDIEYRPPCLYLLHSRVAPAGSCPGRMAPTRTASTSRWSMRSPCPPRRARLTSGPWPGTSRSVTPASRRSCTTATAPWSSRTSRR